MRVGRKRIIRGVIYLLIFVFVLKWIYGILENENPNDQSNQNHNHDYVDDRKWLSNIKTSKTDEIPTVIVEEHYEVLKYWFQAAELDLIPKSKNVLLHIDAHIDGAIPYDVDAIPWFRFPRDENEVFRMMQRNDMFIVAAAVTGFIDHFIWVWPTWDEESHRHEEGSRVKIDVEIGMVQTGSGASQPVKTSYLCACWALVSSTNGEERGWDCSVKNTTCFDGTDCPEIPRSRCMIVAKAVIEVVSASVARQVLAEEKWSPDKGFILDVDEDYFGSWSDVIPLHDSGIQQMNIDVLSDLVSYLFCVSTVEEEIMVDRLYVSILSLIKMLKSQSCAAQDGVKKTHTKCLRNVEIENLLIQREDDMIAFIRSKRSLNFLCESEEKVAGLFFQSLLHFLLNFTTEQLDLLQELGICLKTSPSSPDFESNQKLHVCHGDNIPNRTLIPFHLPSKEEVHFNTVKLKNILSGVVKAPHMITICRSIRDGYTPKSLSPLIESNILRAISKTFRRVNASSVYFDSNLLGGKTGWRDRDQPGIQDLIHYLKLR